MDNKYIICIPQLCGFNDVMVQIYEAYEFAKKTNRKLIIDTRLSGLADHLSNYMELIDPSNNIELALNEHHIKELNKYSCFPKEFTGKIDAVYNIFKSSQKNESFLFKYVYLRKKGVKRNLIKKVLFLYHRIMIEVKNRTITKKMSALRKSKGLELLVKNKEDVILYYSHGGGEASIEAIKLFKLKDSISKMILDKLQLLGLDYDAIHIRNTDYSTNYLAFLKSIQKKVVGRKVLICSDDFFIIDAAREILNESEIITFNNYYNADNKSNNSYPMHYQWTLPKNKIKENNLNIFIDLLGISKSTNFYYTKLETNINSVSISGFSKLGENLKNNQQVVKSWLEGA